MDMAYIQFSYNLISYQRPRNIDFKAPSLHRDFMMSPFHLGLARALVEEIQLGRKFIVRELQHSRGRIVFLQDWHKTGRSKATC